MKFFTALILSLLLLSNSLRILAVYGWYTLNFENFIEQLCENKDKPELQCNGKCYLSKITAETSKEKNPSSLSLKWEQLVFYQIDTPEDIAYKPFFKRKNNFKYNLHYKYKKVKTIFNPPKNV